MHEKTIAVGMSGGVDSSVTAYLLKKEGYNVIGLFMKNWEEKDEKGICRSSQDYEDVVRTCEHIGIPYYAVNFCEEYQTQVFQEFLKDCQAGLTPNPDVLCNREIKFKVFLDKALSLGADYLATGHYAQNHNHLLYKGTDPDKDQSYFLYTLSSSILKHVLFPVGGLNKSEVRQIAKEAHIPVYDKKDSTGICFIGKGNFKDFVSQYLGFTPGNLVNLKGEILGKHDGLAYHTLGQRKGLKLGGEGEAWFVVKKDIAKNALIVERGAEHPSLYADSLIASQFSWVAGEGPKDFPIHCSAKIRYRQKDQACTILKIENGSAQIIFNEPQRAISPGQAIVFYRGDMCLGGGKIMQAGPSYYDQKKKLLN